MLCVEASGKPILTDGDERHGLGTDIGPIITAGTEPAPRHPQQRVRHGSRDRPDARFLAVVFEAEVGTRKCECVGMARLRKQVCDLAFLDDLAGVHNRQRLTHLYHHTEIVGDEQDAGSGRGHDLSDQIENLGLDRHVEAGRGLVQDYQLRRAQAAPWRS